MFDTLTILSLVVLFQFLFSIFLCYSWFVNRMRAEFFKREVEPRAKVLAHKGIEAWVIQKEAIAQRSGLTPEQKKAYMQEKTTKRYPNVSKKDITDLVDKAVKEG